MPPFLLIALTTLGAVLLGAAILHLIPRLGSPGKALAAWLCRAPGLDVMITYFTVAPMFAGAYFGVRLLSGTPEQPASPWLAALLGFLAAVLGQVVAVCVWTVLHELANRKHLKGPRIVHTLNRKVGRVRNHTAVWWTALAVPLFWFVRLAEYIVYPPLTWLIRLPKYNTADWVNVSRQKFDGLVGHDLIWCLYCDWMTGVWSLGGEMLRNVETFWCPIRFDSSKKCDNCQHDFPDVAERWTPSNSTMAEVTRRLDENYPGPDGDNSWWGHPARLTVSAKKK
ncbi:MAG: hypothetical protein HND58_07345 [Planctomycetota bacterium]|nr:MAG: hypothetical protein HND58_07345 [Planctomycetota bacterium]